MGNAPVTTDPTDDKSFDTSLLRGILQQLEAHTTTSIGSGHKEVTTAGTPVPLAASTAAKWVQIHAYSANTGRIAIGGSGVNASTTIGTGTGASLAAGESTLIPISDLATVFIDATVSGEGVRYTYGT